MKDEPILRGAALMLRTAELCRDVALWYDLPSMKTRVLERICEIEKNLKELRQMRSTGLDTVQETQP